jgi:hypothetical protein
MQSEIHAELESLGKLAAELAQAPQGNESWALRARGSIIHDFYTGIEHILVRIADELNGGVPNGHRWHQELLNDMAIAIAGVRPAVISEQAVAALTSYLRFRHLFRNIYGFALDPAKMEPLEEDLPDTLAVVRHDLEQFAAWLVG